MTFLAALVRSPSAQAMAVRTLEKVSSAAGQANRSQKGFLLSILAPHSAVRTVVQKPSCELVGAGRVRLDRKRELIEELQQHLAEISSSLSDLELAVLAYSVWGEGAAHRLYGDFAYLVWDERRQEIFCIRDQIGVCAMAYLETPQIIWISNSIDALALVPDLDRQNLDARWIADFLGVKAPDNVSRSVFKQIRRLPPAHSATIANGQVQTKRYWSLEPEKPLFLNSSGQYLEQFHELLDQSIADRVPTGKVGISLSGGLDSTTLAAKSVEFKGGPSDVVSSTWVINGSRDPELGLSRLAARFLGISQEVIEASNLHYEPAWYENYRHFAEPRWSAVYPASRAKALRNMAQLAGVWLHGEGPDNALTYEWRSYVGWLLRDKNWTRTGMAVADYFRSKTLAEWGQSLGSRLQLGGIEGNSGDPSDWVKVHEPLESVTAAASWRPQALRGLRSGLWSAFLEELEVDFASTGLEWRHPFLETNLLEFMVRTPPIPWGRHKRLMRQAMRGRLPADILKRKKASLYVDLYSAELGVFVDPASLKKGSFIEEFIDLKKLPEAPRSGDEIEAVLKAMILERWLETEFGNAR